LFTLRNWIEGFEDVVFFQGSWWELKKFSMKPGTVVVLPFEIGLKELKVVFFLRDLGGN
jgi:hypothetical protein